MSPAQHSRAPAVVRHSRFAAALAVLWLCLHPAQARATEQARAPKSGDYATALGAAYVLAPVLALAVGGGMFELSRSDTVAVVSGCSMFLLPPIVHVANGAGGRGAAAFGYMVVSTALGVGVGGALGYVAGNASCDEETNSECDLAWMGPALVGAIAGGVLGYGISAFFDTSDNSSLPVEAESKTTSNISVTPWLIPIAASAGPREGSRRGFDGAALGATLVW